MADMEGVRLEVPCSTSNLGPGFDTLGLALDWRLSAEAVRAGRGLEVEISGYGPEKWHDPLVELVKDAVAAWEKTSGTQAGGVRLALSGDLPLARGLGSSAAYRLASAAAVNALAGGPLDRDRLLDVVCALETHTDNTVPCMVGGLTVSGWDNERVRYLRFPVPEKYRFVALVPDAELTTAKARAVLPPTVPREDAVFNMQRALWLVDALANDRTEKLRGVFVDRLHQPFRQAVVPFLERAINAAIDAGAYGGFLSGAGSSVIAVTSAAVAEKVGKAMSAVLQDRGEKGTTRVLSADNRGLAVAG